MSQLEILRTARAKLVAGWTQGAYARTAGGVACHYADPSAAKFCMVGAIRSSMTGPAEALYELFGGAAFMKEFNDKTTHAMVLQTFDDVIAALEAKEKA